MTELIKKNNRNELLLKCGKQEFEVDYKSKKISYIPRSRKEKIQLLKKMIWTTNDKRWLTIPKCQAELEKQCFKELINAISEDYVNKYIKVKSC